MNDLVDGIKIMVALMRCGIVKCHLGPDGVAVAVGDERVALLSLSDRPNVKKKIDESGILLTLGK